MVKLEGRRFIIRDIETKETLIRDKIVMEFNSINAARRVYAGINWVKDYYEIYDTKEDKIVNSTKLKKYGRPRKIKY